MPHFKDSQNNLYWLDDADVEQWAKPGWAQIADEEADALRQTLMPKTPAVVVTMRQARLALLNAGLLGRVNDAISAMPGADGDAARIEWEFSSTVDRGKPFVQSISSALGLSESQLDELFEMAATL